MNYLSDDNQLLSMEPLTGNSLYSSVSKFTSRRTLGIVLKDNFRGDKLAAEVKANKRDEAFTAPSMAEAEHIVQPFVAAADAIRTSYAKQSIARFLVASSTRSIFSSSSRSCFFSLISSQSSFVRVLLRSVLLGLYAPRSVKAF